MLQCVDHSVVFFWLSPATPQLMVRSDGKITGCHWASAEELYELLI